jgi:hypothetical protein
VADGSAAGVRQRWDMASSLSLAGDTANVGTLAGITAVNGA